MEKVTILMAHNKSPEAHDLMSIQCRNVCNELKKIISLDVNWALYPPAEISVKSDYTIFDIEKYESILEIVKKIKPDIMIINGSFDFHNVDAAIVARFMKIPLAVLYLRNFPQNKEFSKASTLYSRIKDIFSNKIIAVHKEELEHSKFNLIDFYKKRYFSLYNTLQKTKHGKLDTFKFLMSHAKLSLTVREPINRIISGELNFCATKNWKKLLMDSGFTEKSIFKLGDPYFDNLFYKISPKIEEELSSNSKTKILFCTSTMHEHGLCSRDEEFNLIASIINKITEDDKFEIVLKIHPGTSSKKEYESEILKKIKTSIPIAQKEDLVELIKKSDLMIAYGGTSAMLYGVIIKKPIINLDFNTRVTGNNVWPDKNIIFECKNIDELNENIKNELKKEKSNENINQFIDRYIGNFDGNNSKRVSEKIYEYLKNIKN